MARRSARRLRRRKSFGFPAFITGQLAMFFMTGVIIVAADFMVLSVVVAVAIGGALIVGIVIVVERALSRRVEATAEAPAA